MRVNTSSAARWRPCVVYSIGVCRFVQWYVAATKQTRTPTAHRHCVLGACSDGETRERPRQKLCPESYSYMHNHRITQACKKVKPVEMKEKSKTPFIARFSPIALSCHFAALCQSATRSVTQEIFSDPPSDEDFSRQSRDHALPHRSALLAQLSVRLANDRPLESIKFSADFEKSGNEMCLCRARRQARFRLARTPAPATCERRRFRCKHITLSKRVSPGIQS